MEKIETEDDSFEKFSQIFSKYVNVAPLPMLFNCLCQSRWLAWGMSVETACVLEIN